MNDRSRVPHGPHPDVADVVTGPVGSARLVDPAEDPDPRAEVQELPGAANPRPTSDQDEDEQPDPREAPPAATDETARD